MEAARALGASTLQIIVRHILPNTLAVIIVQATLQVASAILTAAAPGFLGLGIMITVLGFNLLGDAVRDALDPRMRL